MYNMLINQRNGAKMFTTLQETTANKMSQPRKVITLNIETDQQCDNISEWCIEHISPMVTSTETVLSGVGWALLREESDIMVATFSTYVDTTEFVKAFESHIVA